MRISLFDSKTDFFFFSCHKLVTRANHQCAFRAVIIVCHVCFLGEEWGEGHDQFDCVMVSFVFYFKM